MCVHCYACCYCRLECLPSLVSIVSVPYYAFCHCLLSLLAGMSEVPEWLLFDQQDVHDTLVATSKHKPHLIADMAAMANVPGLANGQARRPVVIQTQQYASQVSPGSVL